ncbi:transcriptional regulator [Phormidium sp. LEGE 05292]|uniref:helix-turn-helix domain-containing transcriptional regulator n=1 Tax=[Phormidium] sp. LEGE 05292 TaxID=767427 RepID=UPI001880AF53|nr:transcriptional regulator [Phormidium sp. LEGE 05292]MBE9225029.1 transcriptional regulator [Phormidium sp. LEGE 05292]
MKNVKVPTSRSYHEFLIESLENREEAAGYIEIVLEEGGDQPVLLRKAIRNVVEAWERCDRISESTKQLHEKLDRMLTESNATEIYTFFQLLNELGFHIIITPKETQS